MIENLEAQETKHLQCDLTITGLFKCSSIMTGKRLLLTTALSPNHQKLQLALGHQEVNGKFGPALD